MFNYSYNIYDIYLIPLIYFGTNIFFKNIVPFILKLIFLFSFIIIKLSNFNNIFHNLMVRLSRYRVINDRQDTEPYLLRYYLFIKDRDYFPFNFFLHKFLKSDPDDLHDHPWPFITIILYGGYWEHTIDGRKTWWGAGTFRYASSETFHRVELDPNYPDVWTLFIPGPKQREWGFKTEKGWIHNTKYLIEKSTK